MTMEYVEFMTTTGQVRRIYKDEDPSGFFMMSQGPTAPMHGLDGIADRRSWQDDDYDHMQTYRDDLA